VQSTLHCSAGSVSPDNRTRRVTRSQLSLEFYKRAVVEAPGVSEPDIIEIVGNM
jgi:hypothetical protein